MDERIIYRILESRMLDYKDYKDIPVEPLNEQLVPIVGSAALTTLIIREDALPITGNSTYVRKGVNERLNEAAQQLSTRSPGLALDVGYGYRALSVQRRRFKEALERVPVAIIGEARIATAHRQVAVPEIGGHTAGAAVDIRLTKKGAGLDFGTNLWEYRDGIEGKKIYTNAPGISREAKKNRYMLRELMLSAGFAPYDGEWWHFSYGDREWAKYYNKPAALYEQIEFRPAAV